MNKFKKWLIPIAVVCLLLATLVGCQAPLGEVFDPSGNPFAHRFSDVTDIRAATYVVAASDSAHEYEADYICDGTADQVQIQAAIDALPATGGEVLLLDGTYNIEVALVMDSYQTLRGCGRNTILTTSTVNLTFLRAVGGAGTEKIGIVIADLQIDGGAGAVSEMGIYFKYVDYSLIQNVYSRRHASGTGSYLSGIYLYYSDFNTITDNTCQGNGYYGIFLYSSSDFNSVTANTCQGNGYYGVELYTSSNNTVTSNICQGNSSSGIWVSNTSLNNTISGNTCQGNARDGVSLDTSCNHNSVTANTCQGNTWHGIALDDSCNHNTVTSNICRGNYDGIYLYTSSYNTVSGNACQENTRRGIYLNDSSNHNTITGNTLTENSQNTTNLYDDILLYSSDYNNIQGNTCRAGALANKPRYGINISNAACDMNIIQGNDLYNDGFGTAPFNDVGTCTIVQDDNRGIEITQVRIYVNVKNTSGGALAAGDVVILKAAAAGNEVTTTATAGDDMVYGMVAESINNNAYGYVLVIGKTTALKVSGEDAAGGDIAIGDLIGTHDAAGISQKAAAGDMAFAIALEAYAGEDHNGVIDALLIKPRKV